MVTKPIYNFDSGASVGIEEVPNNSIVHIQDVYSDSSNEILQIVKTGDDGTLGGKTITEFLNSYSNLYTTLNGGGAAGVTAVLQATVDDINGDDTGGARFGDPLKPFKTIEGVLSNVTFNNTVEIFIIGTANWGGKQYQFIGKNVIFYAYDTGSLPGVDTSKIVLTSGFSAYLAFTSNMRFYIKTDLEYGAGDGNRAFFVRDNSSVQFIDHRVHTFTTSLATADPYVANATPGILRVPNAGAVSVPLVFVGGANSYCTFSTLDIDDAVLAPGVLSILSISLATTTTCRFANVTFNGSNATLEQDFVDRTIGIKRYADGSPYNLIFPLDISGTTTALTTNIDILVPTDGETVFVLSNVQIDNTTDINLYVNGMRKPNGSGAGLVPPINSVFTLAYLAPDTTLTFTSGNERDANDTIYIEPIK